MYRSPTGELELRVGLLMALLGPTLILLTACGGQSSAKGGGGQENNSTTGGSAAANGQIVFRRWFDPDQTKDAIFTMNPDGSHVSQITHPPKGWADDSPVWSPDGTKVAFYRQSSDDSYSWIMVVNPDTGDARKVTKCTAPCDGGHDPAFSPDGRSLSYKHIIGPDTDAERIGGIWIVGLDGSNPHQVTNVDPKLPASFEDFGSAFSPDGKMLVFDRELRQREPQLGGEEPYYHAVFVQPLDSSGSPGDARQITPWESNCGDHPEFSPDGKLVLFRCVPKGEGGPSNLYWVHPDGTGLHALTHAPADKQYLGSCFSPSFSEGEGWITAGRTPGYGEDDNADVFRMRIEDGEVVSSENLTKSALWDSAPSWGTHPAVH
jgi:Tol biopolymer transport system component